MKRVLKYLSYLLIPLMVLSLVYWDKIVPFLKGLNSSDSGILLSLFNVFGKYFKDADGWSVVLSLIIVLAAMIIFIGLDFFIGSLANKINNKYFNFIKKDWFKFTFQKLIVILILGIFFTSASNFSILYVGKQRTTTVSEAEKNPVLVLGTNKYLRSKPGAENLYYSYRIDKAIELFDQGKASYFVVSGDRTESENYDETIFMRDDLIARGIPEQLVKRDTAGYRTLDSMLRLRALYGLNDVTIVTQGFHVPRALFLSWFYGMNATAVNADGSSTKAMITREILAKPKMILDLFFFNMQPKAGKQEFREEFAINTEASAWLIVVMVIAIISVLWAFFNLIENRTKGIYKKLIVASLSTTGAILLTVVVYKNTEIEAFDNIIKKVSENTGVMSGAVKAKEEKKKSIELVEEKTIAKKKEIMEIVAVVDSIKLAEISFDDKVDSVSLDVEIDREVTKEELFSSIDDSENKKKEIKKPVEKEIVAVKEEKEDKGIFGSINDEGSESNVFASNESSIDFKNTIKIGVILHGTQKVRHDSKVKLRLSEDIKIKGKDYPKNYVFDGRIIIESDKVKIKFALNGKEGFIIDESENKLLSDKAYQYKGEEYILSSISVHNALL